MKPLPVSNDGPPRQLGRFELVAELASGGMATVYLGRLGGAGGFQRFVAIKRLHSHLANDAEFVDMFLDEARLAARLHHPNVVPILEIGTSDVGYYLVMEYVEGETLARLLNVSHQAGAPVPINVTVRVFLDVLAGLHAAHELTGDDGRGLDIVHRDVSPQNVLVGVEGSAKITDFGVAHAADRLAHTRTGQLKGKFSYMAPEQALGYSVDRRADVFAVGTCLWEALACKRLFKGDSEADTLEKVLRGPIPRLRSLVPAIPPQIEEVVARALDRERDRRYRSAAHFAEMLEAAALHAGVLGTQRDVSAHVQRVLGPLLTQQREAVRQWIAGMEQHRPSAADFSETRGPNGPPTRVDVPQRSTGRRDAPPPSIPVSVAPMSGPSSRPQSQMRASASSPPQQSLLAMVDERPTAAVPAAVAAAAVAAADEEMSTSSVAIGAVERSTVSHVTRPRSSTLPTLVIAAVLVAAGVAVGVFNSQASSAEESAKGDSPKPQASTTTASANRNGPPPVPTTPIGTPLTAPASPAGPASPINQLLAQTAAPSQGPVVPAPPLGAPGAPPPPPVPTTPLGSLSMREPVNPSPATAVPTVAVNELPAAPHPRAAPRSAPRPARAERSSDRDRDRDDEPRPRRAERPAREDRGSSNDDDLGRNPYK